MHVEWVDGRAYADREALAGIYQVSQRTIRRRCQPVRHLPRRGVGPGGGTALYDVVAADVVLADIAPRFARATVAAKYQQPPRRNPRTEQP
jgi:hypothetical protein